MRHLPLLAVAAIVATWPGSAHATVLLPGDLGEIARQSSAVVRGTVVGLQVQWVEGRRRVETVVTLDVAESFKGSLSGRVSFQVPGGVMGRYRSITVGAPVFHEGEEVILCLGARPPSLPYVLGLGQGVFRVRVDAASGQKLVTPPALLADPSQDVVVRRGDPSRRPVSLAQFTTTLRAALSVERQPRRGTGRSDPKGQVHQ
jgi:hypothetical protein